MLCWTLCYPMDCSMLGSLSFTVSWSLPKLMSIGSVMPSNHLILCRPPSLALNLSQHQGLFQWLSFFVSGGQSIGVSASVLLMNIQGHYFLALFQICCFQSLTLCHGSEGGQANQRPFLGPWKSDTFRRWRDEFSGGIGSQAHFGEGSRCIYFGRKKIVSLEGCSQIWSPKYGN